ncbi:hypothetical protein GCM10010832_05080 [Psychroflexus planctonicus]|uniref:Uncharacterized protein n=1 Tax=Psychroflexus planctonicus TaxID=1526575 RepID=A0ABQ1SEZ6_9FLAO|nr:hypothetical protein GCM10010832_05080 [Psychroflexus planctonicus]
MSYKRKYNENGELITKTDDFVKTQKTDNEYRYYQLLFYKLSDQYSILSGFIINSDILSILNILSSSRI